MAVQLAIVANRTQSHQLLLGWGSDIWGKRGIFAINYPWGGIPIGDLQEPPTSPRAGIHCSSRAPNLSGNSMPCDRGTILTDAHCVAPAPTSTKADVQPCLPCWWQQLPRAVCWIRNTPIHGEHWDVMSGVEGTDSDRQGGRDVLGTFGPPELLDLSVM